MNEAQILFHSSVKLFYLFSLTANGIIKAKLDHIGVRPCVQLRGYSPVGRSPIK